MNFPAVALSREGIESFFKDNDRLRAAFGRFLERGAEGWILADGARWVSYGWITNCARFVPPHFGGNLAGPMDWIFYCGTHPDYRGRGAFTALLTHMAKTRLNTERELFVDTLVENAPSRRAVNKAGFEPCGMMWSLSLKLPKMQPLIHTGWNRRQTHPLIG